MNIKPIEQAIQLFISNCDRIVITAGPEFNWRKRKSNRVLASLEDASEIKNLSALLNIIWDEESQGWLDNWPRLHINFLKGGKLTYAIGVANRATIMVSDFDGVLSIVEYERFGEWLETLGIDIHKV